jgi:hypothetical protein
MRGYIAKRRTHHPQMIDLTLIVASGSEKLTEDESSISHLHPVAECRASEAVRNTLGNGTKTC